MPTPLLPVSGGVLLSWFAHLDALENQAHLASGTLVPPLLYIETWRCSKRVLWKAIGPVFGLVAATILVIAYGSPALFPRLTMSAAFALAAALVSTDTLAVANLTRDTRTTSRLKILLNGEVLFDDAVALVAFQLAVKAVKGDDFSGNSIATL